MKKKKRKGGDKGGVVTPFKITIEYQHVCPCGEQFISRYPIAPCPECTRPVESKDVFKESVR